MSHLNTGPSDTAVQGANIGPRQRSWVWFWLLLVLLFGAAAGYFTAGFANPDIAAQYRQLKSQFEIVMAQYQHDHLVLQDRMDALRGQMLVEESTRKSLEATLQATQDELGRTRDQLAFFDRLLPPGPNGSINVRALDFERRGPTLLYKVLLMRNAPGGDAFAGQMQFVADGVVNGKPTRLTLEPAKAASAEEAAADVSDAHAPGPGHEPLALRFEQFQRSEGLLDLPEGFEPRSVTLNVLEGKTLRTTRKVNLPSVE